MFNAKHFILAMLVVMTGGFFASCGGDDDELPAAKDSGDGDPTEFIICPDSKHPHAIDLGLPSGTKWSCCNVGASTPEDYGGYYAWGETEEKSEYSLATYAHYNSSIGKYVNIGTDIAGTKYDVAHVKMGGVWRMHSRVQRQEIFNSCSHQWTKKNGVFGILVRGKNGNSIFLPASGYCGKNAIYDAGDAGYYWSGSFGSSLTDASAYSIHFDSDTWGWYNDYSREFGYSIRAVCP